MSTPVTSHQRFPIFRRLWKPAVITSASGSALALWLDELLIIGQEILALLFLPILAGAIYLLDILIFKSHMPKKEDLK